MTVFGYFIISENMFDFKWENENFVISCYSILLTK